MFLDPSISFELNRLEAVVVAHFTAWFTDDKVCVGGWEEGRKETDKYLTLYLPLVVGTRLIY